MVMDLDVVGNDFPFASIVSPWQERLSRPGDIRKCPDVHVGPISGLPAHATKDAGIWRHAVGPQARTRPDGECLILVMESPHVDEFAKAKGDYVPWPANGASGQAIQKFASVMAKDLQLSPSIGLLLFNAVPFQCSLGRQDMLPDGAEPAHNWKTRRDEVFRKVWDCGGRDLFLARLGAWYRSGDTVVNACTRGVAGRPLRDMVEEAIRMHPDLRSGSHARRRHPSAWFTAERARCTWEPRTLA